MQTYLVYMRNPLEYFRKGRIRQFLSLQFIIGGKTAILLINPLMWMLLLIYILLHTFVSGAYHALYPVPVLYMGTLCLIFGNMLYSYTHLIGCMKRGHYRLVTSTLLLPMYWAMASGAAYIALYQLVIKPHYWEKTVHGLHLLTQTATHTLKAITQEVAVVSDNMTDRLKAIRKNPLGDEEKAPLAQSDDMTQKQKAIRKNPLGDEEKAPLAQSGDVTQKRKAIKKKNLGDEEKVPLAERLTERATTEFTAVSSSSNGTPQSDGQIISTEAVECTELGSLLDTPKSVNEEHIIVTDQ
jgi:hypothetical protein